MTTRTNTTKVTFTRPFVLADMREVLPPGVYVVETDEAPVEDSSFLAYRRVAVRIQLPSRSGNPALTRSISLHPRLLDAALQRDKAPASVASA